MKILVYEYFSGGGLAKKPMSPGILSEAFGMLRTLVSDIKAAGHSVTTVLDSRLALLKPPLEADHKVRVSSFQEAKITIQEISKSIDAAYIIAPESNNVLESLVENVEQEHVSSINCMGTAIEKVSDKPRLLAHAKEMGLPTPTTVLISTREDSAGIGRTIGDRLGFPLIIKPVDGVGCTGLSLVRNENQVAAAVAKVNKESSSEYFVAQELINGTAVSVTLLSTGREASGVSLNKQHVSLMPPEYTSSYNGGQVPFNSLHKREAFAFAQKLVRSFQGLRGYIGVDLVLTEKGPIVIEVNPRLTTSYIAAREIVGFNLAQAVINSVLEKELPDHIQSKGYALFSKIITPKPAVNALQETYLSGEIISPPFPFSDNNTAYALVMSHRDTLNKAMFGLREAKKRLRGIIRLEGN